MLAANKTEPFSLAKGLTLYKQPKSPGRGSPNWYVRARINLGGRKVHAKSTGTNDLRLATEFAYDYLSELIVQKGGGIIPNGRLSDRAYRFDVVADAWLDELQRSGESDDRKCRRYHDHRKIAMAANGLAAFFGKRDIRSITTTDIADYITFAERGSKHGAFKPTTKKNHLSTLSQLLTFAVDTNRLDRVPKMPKVKMRDNPRPRFDERECRMLLSGCEAAFRFLFLSGLPELADEWEELEDFIRFMLDSFLRPSEWAELKQKHIDIIDGEHPYLRITVVRGKTGGRLAVTMPGAVETYRRILRRRGSDLEQYVFMPSRANRAMAKERMGRRFNELLELTGLAFDQWGRKRTTYSLRHTALTLRVLKGDGVPLILLARNAGTSVRMLDRFYCSDIQAEQNIASLQSYKVKPVVEDVDSERSSRRAYLEPEDSDSMVQV